jgi:hypothetical protein
VNLGLRVNGARQAWPSRNTLIKETGLTARQIRTAIARLEKANILHVQRKKSNGFWRANCYTIKFFFTYGKDNPARQHDQAPQLGHQIPLMPSEGQAPDTRAKRPEIASQIQPSVPSDQALGRSGASPALEPDRAKVGPNTAQIEGTGAKRPISKTIEEKDQLKKKSEALTLGEAQNVVLSPEELEKLSVKFGDALPAKIEALSVYKASRGKKYKSDYFTILNWDRMEQAKKGDHGAIRRFSEKRGTQQYAEQEYD